MAGVTTPVNVTSLVSVKSLALFFRHVSVLVKSGISIYQAISDSASYAHNHKLSKAAKTVAVDVSNGVVLSSALQKHPDVFPVNLVASVWCGELSGKLDVVIDEIAAELEEETKDQGFARIGWVITKLSMIMLFFVIPLINFNTIMMPMFKESLNDLGFEQLLKVAKQKYIENALPTSILLCVTAIIFWSVWPHVKRTPSVRLFLDKILLTAPIWGEITKSRAISRICRNMELLSEAGLPIQKAWDAASLTSKNSYLAAQLHSAGKSSTSINSASETMRYSRLLSNQEIGVLAAGEKAGRVPEAFSHLNSYYSSVVDRQKKNGKTWSIGALVIGLTILSGIIVIKFMVGYFDFVFKVGDMFTQ